MEKSEARAFVLERRDGIETRVHAEKCTTICGVLTEMLGDIRLARENVSSAAGVCYRQEPLAVALYQAMKSEVSLDCFIEEVYERGLTACFPCMVKHPTETGRNTSMTFRAVSREQYEHGGVAFLDHPLRSFADDDPALASYPLVDTPMLDVVIVPLVAFDGENNRLGYGGGNYDRLIDDLRDDAVAIGVAFEEQRIDSVPCEPHDKQLPAIVSA